MRIATVEEMKELDRATIEELGISGLVLMENAGLRVAAAAKELLPDIDGKKITVIAGKGNNGGDGFVVARHLINMGAEVKVLLLCGPNDVTGDAKVNLDILLKMDQKIHVVIDEKSINILRIALVYSDLVIDAIFGIGFKGVTKKPLADIIDIINEAGKPIIAVDVPSGLEANTGKVHGSCIKATCTVTFGLPKLGLMVFPGAKYVGQLQIGDISIPQSLIERYDIPRFLITAKMVKEMIKPREPEGHKGDYGRVTVLGGSPGLTGAVYMAGQAAARIGAGLVTVGLPMSLHDILEVKLTEVMTKPLPETDRKTISKSALNQCLEMVAKSDVVAVGPGMSTELLTVKLIQELVQTIEKPLIIDADGLNAIAINTDILKKCTAPLVLTPHPGEMARLMGIDLDEINNNRISIALTAAKNFKAIIVLKGARTIIATPAGRLYINANGNPGMATGGSGDVLTGIIAGLVAQGLSLEDASVAGVFIHGLAGDLVSSEKGQMGLLAGDLIDMLPQITKNYC